MIMSREESGILSISCTSQLDSNCLFHELDLEHPEYDALTSIASAKDRVGNL